MVAERHIAAPARFAAEGQAGLDVVEAIEVATGKPVVTSNQALAWDVLRGSGNASKLQGRGRLFC